MKPFLYAAITVFFIQNGSTALAAGCPDIFIGYQHPSGPWKWKISGDTSATLLDPNGNEYGASSLQRLASGEFDNGVTEEQRPRLQEWARCHLTARKGGSVLANAGASGAQAEQIPNCPPTLPPSCVTWSQYDQQLQWWNLTNNCGRDVSVTFRSEGALENTQTFGNGESYRAKWRGANPPKQIVWDAAKGFGFYRNKPAGAALKCQSSLPL